MHGDLRKQSCRADATGERPPPALAVNPAGGGRLPRQHGIALFNQNLAEEPGRLHRHADPFRHDRVSLARQIPCEEYPVHIPLSDPGADRTSSQPMPLRLCAEQGVTHACAAIRDVLQSGFTSAPAWVCITAALQYVAPYTERQA